MSSRSESTPGPRLRAFVSSVIDGFEAYREAARRAIEAAGADPIMVNENFPSQAKSSRNTCLDAIESSDCLISIVGERGGWKTPSGRLVVEEEFAHARLKGRPILAFVQETTRDDDAQRFVQELSDYVGGVFRTTFVTAAQLEEKIRSAVSERVAMVRPVTSKDRDLSSYLAPQRRGFSAATILRFALVPEREEEVIDPVKIGSKDLGDLLLELGHGRDVRLFSFTRAKEVERRGGELIIEQDGTSRSHDAEGYVRMQLDGSGLLLLDGGVTGANHAADHSIDASFVVAIEDVQNVLAAFFRFTAALVDEIDRYRRYERFCFNVGLEGLGYRSLERNPRPRQSYGMVMRASDGVIAAYPTSRLIARAVLKDPENEITRVLELLDRQARG